MLLAALTLAGCWILVRLLPVLLVIVAALFLVGTLGPLVDWLERQGLRRGFGIGAVFVSMFLVTLLLAALTFPALFSQVKDLIDHEPEIRSQLADLLARSRVTSGLSQALRNVHYDALAKQIAGPVLVMSQSIVEVVAYILSAVFLALYIMLDRDRLRGGLFALTPRRHHIRLSCIILNLETIVGGYIRGQLITSSLMAGVVFVLLTALGVANPVAVAAFAGAADILPYIGVFLSVGPAAAAASGKGLVIVLVVVGVLLAYEEFESRFLIPKIYGSALRLPSSIVLVALLCGGTLLGIVGALLALPAAAAIRMLVEQLRFALPGEAADPLTEQLDQRAERDYRQRASGLDATASAAIAGEIAAALQNAEDIRPSSSPPR
jgi:predicted PurR-regulated permease PerM